MKRDYSIAVEDSFVGNKGTEREEERQERLSWQRESMRHYILASIIE